VLELKKEIKAKDEEIAELKVPFYSPPALFSTTSLR
jgi:hypothetical protein